MKGLRLFARRLSDADEPLLGAFWKQEKRSPPPSLPDGLIGFILGDLAVVAALDHSGEDMVIRDLWVAQNLRRRRVARAMLAEIEAEARALGVTRILAHPSNELVEVFRRLGFEPEADGTMVRPVEGVR